MKNRILFLSLLVFSISLVLLQSGCANTAGTAAGSTGTASLSIELSEPNGSHFQSLDGYDLDISRFELNFTRFAIGAYSVTEDFTAECAGDEASDIITIEDLPGGAEFSDIQLSLDSVTITATAVSGGNECLLEIQLTDDIILAVGTEENLFQAVANEESELLIEIDPNALFSVLDVPSACTGGNTISISSTSNVAAANTLASQFLEDGVITLGNTEGHSHDH